MDSRGQIVQRKDYIILSGEEFSLSKRLFPVTKSSTFNDTNLFKKLASKRRAYLPKLV